MPLSEIFFGWLSGFLPTDTVSTPFARFASTCSQSALSGSVKARVKLPYDRSYA